MRFIVARRAEISATDSTRPGFSVLQVGRALRLRSLRGRKAPCQHFEFAASSRPQLLVSGALAGACSEPTATDGIDAPRAETPSPSTGLVRVAPDTVTMEPGDSIVFRRRRQPDERRPSSAADRRMVGHRRHGGLDRSLSCARRSRARIASSPRARTAPIAPWWSSRRMLQPCDRAGRQHVLLARDYAREPAACRQAARPSSLRHSRPARGDLHLPAGLAGHRWHDHRDRRVHRAQTSGHLSRHRESRWRHHRRHRTVTSRRSRHGLAAHHSTGTVGTEAYKRSGFWIEVLPSTLKLAPGSGQQFTAVGRTVDGKTYSVNVTWRATGGTISSTGYYKAPSSSGTYRVSAQRVGDVADRYHHRHRRIHHHHARPRHRRCRRWC